MTGVQTCALPIYAAATQQGVWVREELSNSRKDCLAQIEERLLQVVRIALLKTGRERSRDRHEDVAKDRLLLLQNGMQAVHHGPKMTVKDTGLVLPSS